MVVSSVLDRRGVAVDRPNGSGVRSEVAPEARRSNVQHTACVTGNVQRAENDAQDQGSGAWGGTGYVRQELDPALAAWWQSLPISTRTALAAVRPGEVLSREAAGALAATGLVCPEVVVVEEGRRVRRRIASRDVIATVLRVRLNHSERRLV
jgi:hypothetical protein